MTPISDLIGEVPPELNKWRHHYRGVLEYSHMFPHLLHEELVALTDALSTLPTGSIQRTQVVDRYSTLNNQRRLSTQS